MNNSENLPESFDAPGFSNDLVTWFNINKRDLPWRETTDPYNIWVSEIMLQQTQVDTVIPYYERFINQYPSMKHLAKAPEEQVLKMWEGLGYYSRARNLHQGVQEVVERYNAEIPDSRKEILTVKGIGPYTAGAVLSIAYGLREPAVDGNVMRVLSRVFLNDNDITKQKTRKDFELLLYSLIPEGKASAFNQGMMELGALICKPKNPDCKLCPVNRHCLAYDEGVQQEYPVKKKKGKPKSVYYTVLFIKDESGRFLIEKRSSKGLLANMWQFPMAAVDSQEEQDFGTVIKKLTGQKIKTLKKNAENVTHVFSHLKWHLSIAEVTVQRLCAVRKEDTAVVDKAAFAKFPIPVPHQKVMKVVEREREQLELDLTDD